MNYQGTASLTSILALAAGMALSGCADECVDDGLGQKFCPGINSASGSAGGTDSDSKGTADGPETGGNDGNQCPVLDVLLTPQVPTIQFVVDQSGSMGQDFGGISRWDALKDVLVGGNNAIVNKLQSDIRFGLTLYTGDAMVCPNITEIGAQLDAADEIKALLDANMPASETPTGESFALAADTLMGDTWDGDKFIVLATDGEPDTCAVPNPTAGSPEEMQTRQAVVDAVTAAFNNGIRTFVIKISDNVDDTHIQAVANAGVGVQAGDPDAPFYTALGQQGLTDSFDQIISGVRDCKLDLSEPLLPSLAPSCNVTINDADIDYEGTNGWILDGDSTIQLQGTSCTQIQEGVVSIEMTCSCEVTQ